MTAQRFMTDEVADFEVYGKNGVFPAVLKNLSATGAFFEFNEDHKPLAGDIVHLRIHLENIQRIRDLDAEVIWCNDIGFGVQFVRKEDIVDKLFKR